MTLALISNIANHLKYNYFWDCDGINNVTLRLRKFSDFCSRHTVGVAGDDIMFHILVQVYSHFIKYFPKVSHHSCFIWLLGVLLCVFQLCTPISGPRVKVAAELVMIYGFLYRKGDLLHYNVIKWKRILCYCPLVRGIHPSPVDSLHKGR